MTAAGGRVSMKMVTRGRGTTRGKIWIRRYRSVLMCGGITYWIISAALLQGSRRPAHIRLRKTRRLASAGDQSEAEERLTHVSLIVAAVLQARRAFCLQAGTQGNRTSSTFSYD